MKKILYCLILCLLPVFCFAQIRSNVCIIKQNYSDELVATVSQLAPRLKRLGIEDSDEYMDNFIKNGAFGSGFVYVAPDGRNYIITNRHVIEGSKKFQITFQNDEGEVEKEYKNITVLASDGDLDLAILALPEDYKETDKSFSFFKGKLKDGDAVYTAGFPALLGKPSWQFGSGVVTNPNVKSEELIDPEISTVIQHSSQIDAGNSGGPLLYRNEKGEYEVVGINTWKITNRQDTNFAIPIQTIEKFVKEVLSEEGYKEKDPAEVILAQAQKLQKVLNKANTTYEIMLPFISIDYVVEEGYKLLDSIFYQCSQDNRDTMNEALKAGAPVEALRFAVGWYIFNQFHLNERMTHSQKETVSESKLPEVPVPVQYENSDIWYTALYNKSTSNYLKTEWIKVDGGWKLYAVKNVTKGRLEDRINRVGTKATPAKIREIPEEKTTKLGKVTLYEPNTVSVGYYFNPGLSNITEPAVSHTADIEIKLKNWMAIDISSEIMENKILIYHYGEKPEVINKVSAFGGMQFQFPFCKNVGVLMPYATVQAGCSFSDFDELKVSPLIRAELGARANLFIGKKINTTVFLDAAAVFNTPVTDINLKPRLYLGAGLSF